MDLLKPIVANFTYDHFLRRDGYSLNRCRKELAASQGLLPALIFDLSEKASPPEDPLRYGQNTLVLAGGFIGFLVGIWATNLPFPFHFGQVSHRD